jgi:hypothetical protein
MTTLFIDALALWAPTLPGWALARAAFRGEGVPVDSTRQPLQSRPSPELLAPAERRRAPDTVALALEVASMAVAASGHAASELASVFTSAHGDLGITDYLCRTLVNAPTAISPTRFLSSVHNAASGCWTMAVGCVQPSTAVSAFDHSFAAGLLEACVQCAADERAVLLVGYDIEACGALAGSTASRGLRGLALVVSPLRGPRSGASLTWSLVAGPAVAMPLRSAAAQALAGNGMADGLPLFEALALERRDALCLPLSAMFGLEVHLQALAR